VLGTILAVSLAPIAVASFRMNDQSDDTVVGDFYRAAFAMIPPGAVLVPRGGAFGSEVAYFHDLMGLRRDVRVAGRSRSELRSSPAVPAVFTTTEPQVGAAVPLSDRAWFVPVLRGSRHDMTLYRVLTGAPPLVVRDAAPGVRVDRVLGDATLVGYDAPGVVDGRVHLKTYWHVSPTVRVIVATEAGGTRLEAHELGFGNLPRYRAEHGFADGGTVVEELAVVLPAALPRGALPLRVGAIDYSAGTVTPRWASLGEIHLP